MLAWLASFLSGPLINGLIGAYKAKLEAGNTTDAHAADLAKADLLAQIEARKQATILGSNKVASLVQAAFALPVVVYVNKLILWDKIVMAGAASTDPLDGWVGTIATTIVGFYMGGQIVSGVASQLAARLGRR